MTGLSLRDGGDRLTLHLGVKLARLAGAYQQRPPAAAIDVTATNGAVAIEIRDDGRGFDPAAGRAGGFGLRSMRGRAAELGGRLQITSAPGRGTIVRVENDGGRSRALTAEPDAAIRVVVVEPAIRAPRRRRSWSR